MKDYKNSEGYTDPTPHKAMTTVKAGEVWENDRTGDNVLVLGVRANVVTILRLSEEGTHSQSDLKIRGCCTNISMISFIFTNHIGAFRYKLTDDEYDQVKKSLTQYLGMEMTVEASHEAPAPAPEIKTDPLELIFGRTTMENYYKVRMVDELIEAGGSAKADRYMRMLEVMKE